MAFLAGLFRSASEFSIDFSVGNNSLDQDQQTKPNVNPLQAAGFSLAKPATTNVSSLSVENSAVGARSVSVNNQTLGGLKTQANEGVAQYKQAATEFLHQVGAVAEQAGVNPTQAFGTFETGASMGSILMEAGGQKVGGAAFTAASSFIHAKDVIGTDTKVSPEELRARVEDFARGQTPTNQSVDIMDTATPIEPNPMLSGALDEGFEIQEAVDFARNVLNDTVGTDPDLDALTNIATLADELIVGNKAIAADFVYDADGATALSSALQDIAQIPNNIIDPTAVPLTSDVADAMGLNVPPQTLTQPAFVSKDQEAEAQQIATAFNPGSNHY